jgi:hypothetical protein
MPKYTAILEPAGAGNWSAYILGPSLIVGLWGYQRGSDQGSPDRDCSWLDDLKETGQTVPDSSIEVVTVDVPSHLLSPNSAISSAYPRGNPVRMAGLISAKP